MLGAAGKLEAYKRKVAAIIERNRVAYQDMVTRAVATGNPPTGASETLGRFADLTAAAQGARSSNGLDQIEDEAETVAQSRAYLCPEKEIAIEAKAYVFTLSDWGVPAKTIESLKEATKAAFDGTDVPTARGALRSIYEEFDSWSSYLDDYNRNTSFWASVFLCLITLFALAALTMMFGWSWRLVALVVAAIAGAIASVIARLPGVTTYDSWQVNLRAYRARVGTGIVGALVGVGLLGSGLITISLPKDWQSADHLLEACLSASGELDGERRAEYDTTNKGNTRKVRCTPGAGLFVLALTMLLGFSERLLTSLEGRVIPGPTGAAGQGRP